MIGIVGGIGPKAGIDLYYRVLRNTAAGRDQEHLSVLMASVPNRIPDRTDYLLGKEPLNPAYPIAETILTLERAGASSIGIACNTAHASEIYDVMLEELRQRNSNVQVYNMVEETVREIKASGVKKVGVLCTSGSYRAGLFRHILEREGLEPVFLSFERNDELVHQAIYHPAYGIKSAHDLSRQAIDNLNQAASELKMLKSQALILGCTEIGMTENNLNLKGLVVFNPSEILARALVRAAHGKA